MKTEQTTESANRREFLRCGFRYALLAGLTAVSAVVARKRGAALSGQTCINQGICPGCGGFENCGLPQALSAKQALQNSGSRRRQSAEAQFLGPRRSRRFTARTRNRIEAN